MGDEFRARYAAVYKGWADLAEEEIVGAVHLDEPPKKMGLRGREPELVWRSVLPERPPPPPRAARDVARWRTTGMITQDSGQPWLACA